MEYADLPKAIPEVARVLRPGGVLALVSHHVDSRIAAIATEEVSDVRWLLSGDDAPIAAAGTLLSFLAIAAEGGAAALTADPHAQTSRATFNAAMKMLAERVATSTFPDLLIDVRARIGDVLEGIIQLSIGLDVATAALDAVRHELNDSMFRSIELLRHALDEAALEDLGALLHANGFDAPEIGTVRHDTHLLGWRIRVAKRC